MKSKEIEKEIRKITKLLFNKNTINEEHIKTELEIQQEIKSFNEKWRVKFMQFRQNYLLEKKQMLDRLYKR